MVGIVSVSAGSSVHHWLFVQFGDLAHDFAIDTLFGDGEWLFWKWIFVLLPGVGFGLSMLLEGWDLLGTC